MNRAEVTHIGGVHVERLDAAACTEEGLPLNTPWLRLTITDQNTEQTAIIGEETARKLAVGINQLCDLKL